MKTYLQLPLDPRDPESSWRHRRLFHDFVVVNADPKRDRVILIEPNDSLMEELRTLWADWPNTELMNGAVVVDDSGSLTYFRARDDAPDFAWMSSNEKAVRQRFPNSTIESLEIPTRELGAIVGTAAQGSSLALIAVDAGSDLLIPLSSLHALSKVSSIVISINEVTDRLDIDVRALRNRGFSSAGRAWGEAGETLLLTKAGSAPERVQAALANTRAQVGDLVVKARDHWIGHAQRTRVTTQVKARLRGNLRSIDILDPTVGHALPPVSRAEVEKALRAVEGSHISAWTAPSPLHEDPWSLSQECHDRYGVWPLSFSYPGNPLPIVEHPGELVSPIIPGFPYSFTSEADYLSTYAHAYWGLTHRKAGWDCFRHLEIMAAGAVPWMLDAAEIPRYSMVHYPKTAMANAANQLRCSASLPDDATRRAFRTHLLEHLTSRAMARYLLEASGMGNARTVLFVDEKLPHHADYQSVLTLIGLKQLLGQGCRVMYPVDYIYEDTMCDVSKLYGRGFGYTRILPSTARGLDKDFEQRDNEAIFDGIDAVIVGSVTRNASQAAVLLNRFPADRTIWIHGEDLPPTVEEAANYRRSNVHMFVRAIHVRR